MTYSTIDAINDSRPKTVLTAVEESDLILRAQSGDSDAFAQVLRNYIGLIVREIDRVMRGAGALVSNPTDAREEALQDAVLVMGRAIAAWKPEHAGKFGGLLRTSLRNDQNFTVMVNRNRPFTIPRNALVRRAQALREANGDMAVARTLSQKYDVSPTTFDAITNIYNATGAAPDAGDVMLARNERAYVRIEDLQDVRRALDVLDADDRALVEMYFGLNGQAEHSQTELAAELHVSRQTVNKRLGRATLKMQKALNPEETK